MNTVLTELASDILEKYGWDSVQKAGILGNLIHETAGTLDPKILGDAETSFGLAQWNGERRKALESFAESKGRSSKDFETQLDFLNHELNTTEKSAGEALKNATSIEEATKVFSDYFERPGKPAISSRITQAQNVAKGLNPILNEIQGDELNKRMETAAATIPQQQINPILAEMEQTGISTNPILQELDTESKQVPVVEQGKISDLGGYGRLVEAFNKEPDIPKTAIVPAESMIAGEVAPFTQPSGEQLDVTGIGKGIYDTINKVQSILDWPGRKVYELGGHKIADYLQTQSINPEDTETSSKFLTRLIGDIPTYGTIGKGINLLTGVGKPVVSINRTIPIEETLTSKLKLPQDLTGMGEALDTTFTSELAKPRLLEEAALAERVAQGESSLPREVIESLITTPHKTSKEMLEENLKNALFSGGRTGNVRDEARSLMKEVAKQRIAIEKLKVKNPSMTQDEAIKIVASKNKITPGKVIDDIRIETKVNTDPGENLASQVFPKDVRVTDLKSYEAITLKGTPGYVEPGQTIYPTLDTRTLDPNVPRPKWNLTFEPNSDVVSRNVWTDSNNLIGDYQQKRIDIMDNITGNLKVHKNLTIKSGLDTNSAISEEQWHAAITPILERYEKAVSNQRELYAQIQSKIDVLKHLDSTTPEAMKLDTEIKVLSSQIHEDPAVKTALAERDSLVVEFAKKHSNIRTFLGIERPESVLLSADEKLFADETRRMLEMYKQRMQLQGMRVFDDPEKSYMHYLYKGSINPTWFPGKTQGASAFLDFISRVPGSEAWYPLADQSIRHYIPMVERILGFNELTTKWIPAIKGWSVGEFPGTAKYAQQFLDRNLAPEALDAFDKFVGMVCGSEYIRVIDGNLRPGIMHLFKVVRNVAYQGTSTLPGIRDLGKAYAQKLGFSEIGPERRLLDHYLVDKPLLSVLFQNAGLNEMLQPSWWQKVKGVGAFPLTLAEYVGNGLNVFSSINRGLKADMPAYFINREALESMLRLDFRAFGMPELLTERKLKFATMFMGQPYKSMEAWADLGGKSLHELAYPVSRGMEKLGIIEKALLEPEKNMFGESYLPKFVRMAALTGILGAAGKYYGIDLSRQLFHALGMGYAKETAEETLALETPVGELIHQLKEKGIEGGLREHYSWASPITYFEENIPPKYGESRLLSILGIPKLGWEEEAQGIKQRQKIQEIKHSPLKLLRQTPLERLLDRSRGLFRKEIE